MSINFFFRTFVVSTKLAIHVGAGPPLLATSTSRHRTAAGWQLLAAAEASRPQAVLLHRLHLNRCPSPTARTASAAGPTGLNDSRHFLLECSALDEARCRTLGAASTQDWPPAPRPHTRSLLLRRVCCSLAATVLYFVPVNKKIHVGYKVVIHVAIHVVIKLSSQQLA